MSYRSEQALIAHLQRLVTETSQGEVAQAMGIYSGRLGEVLRGERSLPLAVVAALGYETGKVYYRRRAKQ